MCACFGVSVLGYAHKGRSEVNLQPRVSGSRPLSFQSLSLAWNSPSTLGWPARGTHGVCCLCLSTTRNRVPMPCSFTWALGTEPWLLCFQGNHLAIPLACIPAAMESCFFQEPAEQTFVGNFQVATRYKMKCLVFISKPKCHIILI